MDAANIDKEYMESGDDPIFYGLPHTKQYPMPDERHVRSAIRFFNYVSSDDEQELADNINKMIKKYNIKDLNVGPTNRFKKYYKGIESVMTQTAPIVPYGKRLTKPGIEEADNEVPQREVEASEEPEVPVLPVANSLSEMKLHPVFFTLTYHEAGFGKFIKLMTHAPYSHCSLFFDSSLSNGYSFAGREGHKMIPYGMTTESIQKWTRHNPHARFALYVVLVDDEDYKVMKTTVQNMWNRRTDFRYDVEGVVKTFFHKKNANSAKYFCSGFCAMILSKGKTKRLKESYDMYKPMDMPDIYGAHLVDMGIVRDYNKSYVDKKVLQIYNTNYAGKSN